MEILILGLMKITNSHCVWNRKLKTSDVCHCASYKAKKTNTEQVFANRNEDGKNDFSLTFQILHFEGSKVLMISTEC